MRGNGISKIDTPCFSSIKIIIQNLISSRKLLLLTTDIRRAVSSKNHHHDTGRDSRSRKCFWYRIPGFSVSVNQGCRYRNISQHENLSNFKHTRKRSWGNRITESSKITKSVQIKNETVLVIHMEAIIIYYQCVFGSITTSNMASMRFLTKKFWCVWLKKGFFAVIHW